jgi:hypothetical protein
MNSLGSSQGNSNSMSSSSSSNNSLSSWESLRSEEPVQLGSQLLTTLISNDLLAEHVASLEQRVAQLQLYFSQIFADLLAAGDNGAALLHISAEEMCDMEVAGEVVVVSETTTDTTAVTPNIEPRISSSSGSTGGGTAKARRRRRANNNQPRCQPSQQKEGGGGHSTSETVGGAAESSATSLDPGILRTRLRV